MGIYTYQFEMCHAGLSTYHGNGETFHREGKLLKLLSAGLNV